MSTVTPQQPVVLTNLQFYAKCVRIGSTAKTANSRYIPKKIKTVLKQEYGTKCAHSNCTNIFVNIHHTKRFGLDSSHNPLYLAPLCKLHHEIAHIDVKSIQQRKKHTLLVRQNV